MPDQYDEMAFKLSGFADMERGGCRVVKITLDDLADALRFAGRRSVADMHRRAQKAESELVKARDPHEWMRRAAMVQQLSNIAEHNSSLRRRVRKLEEEAAEARGAQIVDQNAIRIQRERAEAAEDFILREGYRPCDVPACNCRSWHRGEARLSQEESDDV